MMHQPVLARFVTLADGLLECIECKVALERARHSRADDSAREDIDHEGNINEPAPVPTYIRSDTHS